MPTIKFKINWLGDDQVVVGYYEAAIETPNQAISRNPDSMYPHIFLSAAHSAVGRLEEAQTEAAMLLWINPDFNVLTWIKSRLLKNPADEKKYASLLLKAGLPETQNNLIRHINRSQIQTYQKIDKICTRWYL